MTNKFQKLYSWQTKLDRLLKDSKKRIVHKDISLIVDGNRKRLQLNIVYKKPKTL